MSLSQTAVWRDGALRAVGENDIPDSDIRVAESWLIADGHILALGLHRQRFLASATHPDAERFWDAMSADLPSVGRWFPRVESHANNTLLVRMRVAPDPSRSAVVATFAGSDPRTTPEVKGPDLHEMQRVRDSVADLGADEAIILTTDGYIVEGAYSGLLWWRGDILCCPPARFARVDSVTARSALTLATALGIDTHNEAVTPAELDGTELWAVSALHGIRIVTGWIDGPTLAERPGRLSAWRGRLDALRRPLR